MGDTRVSIVAPTGTLGYGFDVADFHRVLTEYEADAIVIDAGSTDPGPYYLGSGESFTNNLEVKDELGVIIAAGLEHGIPVIVGSCGGAGAAPHLQWTLDIVTELARERVVDVSARDDRGRRRSGARRDTVAPGRYVSSRPRCGADRSDAGADKPHRRSDGI